MRHLLFVLTSLLWCHLSISQIAINTTSTAPHSSAMLDVTSTEKGLLIPRMSTVQRTAISSPAKGLLVFTDDDSAFWYYNGTGWVDLVSATSTVWKRTGNNAFNLNSGNIGVGTNAPTTMLDVNGSVRVRGLSNSTGNIVRTDSIGRLIGYSVSSSANFTPFQITPKSTTSTPQGLYANPTSVVVSGNEAIVSDYNFATHTYDISNPQNPVLKYTTTNCCGQPRDMVIAGGRTLMVRLGTNDLVVSGYPSVSIPYPPTRVSGFGNLVFVTGDSPNLTIVELTSPSAIVRSNLAVGSPRGVAGLGTHIFVLDGSNSMKVYNIANTQSPQLVTSIPTAAGPERIVISGTFAYVTNNTANSFQIFDVSNPAAPTLTSTTSTGTGPDRIQVQNNRVYITNGTAKTLQVFDVTIPQNPVLKSTISTGQWPSGLAISGNHVYVSIDLEKKLQIFEVPVFADGILAQNSDGSLISMPTSALSDNLGNHVATQALRLADQPLYLKGTSTSPNTTHGLRYSNDFNMDGPRLFGAGGGALGTANNINALYWTSSGNVGIGTSAPAEKLSVLGNITATGTIASSSDIRYKTNVTPVGSILSSLMAISPLYYNWHKDFRGYTPQRQLGFSAQEIERYFPEIVQTDKEGYKAVDYSRMTPILVQAVKELKAENDSLKKDLDLLKHQVAELLKARR